MRRIFFLVILSLLVLLIPTALANAEDWDWLVAQVAEGQETIVLPSDIVQEGDSGLLAKGTVRIDGNGFALTGAVLDGGTFMFRDVRLLGTHAVDDEPGGTALLLRGDGAIAVLMGTTRAEGGTGAMEGETGGDGVYLAGQEQGLILNGSASAVGGIGRLYGGMGIRVEGCNGSVVLSDASVATGGAGLVQAGSGIHTPECCKVSLGTNASANGGGSNYTGGHGILSEACADCSVGHPVALSDMAMAIGGVGQDGGHGILLTRSEITEEADLTVSGDVMIIGGDGVTPGAALKAQDARIAFEGGQLYGGLYYENEADTLQLADCEITGEETYALTAGGEAKAYPAANISTIIQTAIGRQSDRYVPRVIEDGLITRDLQTKLNGFSVDNGNVNQVNVSGNSLKIYMYTGTLEGRMNFRQRLMTDGAEGTRLVLIGGKSDTWPTLESTVAGLRKLATIGITELAYTCVEPVYHDRILNLEALVAAIDAQPEANPVSKVMCGTADDAVIFIYEDGTREYQEPLMEQISVPLEAPVETPEEA